MINTEKKKNEKNIMNSTHITYEVMYNMCYLIIFFFAVRQKKYFFLPRQAKSESSTPLGLTNSPESDPGVT